MSQRDSVPDQSGLGVPNEVGIELTNRYLSARRSGSILTYEGWLETEIERLAHGICDSLKFLPPPTKCAGTAILRAVLRGTAHDGHDADLWPSRTSDEKEPS